MVTGCIGAMLSEKGAQALQRQVDSLGRAARGLPSAEEMIRGG